MHAGAEGSDARHVANREETYLGERRGTPIALAHQAIDADADLVLASSPHVLRGLQWRRGRLIAYSLGDLAGARTLNTQGELGTSILLRVKLDQHGELRLRNAHPATTRHHRSTQPDPSDHAIRLVRALSHGDFGPSAPTISATGAIHPPGPTDGGRATDEFRIIAPS